MDSVNPSVKTELRKTPLNALAQELGAKMVNFGGWDMPSNIHRRRIDAEHKAVRVALDV